MESLNNNELAKLLHSGESDRVEFKESTASVESIREAICAFANNLPGHSQPGVVFVGIRDDGTSAELAITDELLRTLADMKTDGNILPPPSLTVEKRTLEGKTVAFISVRPSDSPPVRCRGRILIRTGPRRGVATSQDERILNERRRYGNLPFDVHPIPAASVSDLNISQFENEYLPNAVSPEILEANDRTREEQLAATKMTSSADSPIATVLGLLVIGSNPSEYLPGAYVQFLKIDGKELSDNVVDQEAIRGTVSDILIRVDNKMQAHNRTSVDYVSRSIESRTELYPTIALQQIVRNAILHRTYENTNAPVRINWFHDRIEVLSPGGPFGEVSPENFGSLSLTDYRNPNLAESLRVLGFVQRFGTGIPLARRSLQEAGHPPLGFSTKDNHVLATIFGMESEQ